MEWQRVKWSEAGQVTALLKWNEPAEASRLAPAAYFAGLVDAGRYDDAVRFLALALPRLEAVAWAVRMVRDSNPGRDPKSAEATALKTALLWLQDPVETRRRAAFEAARACDPGGAEAMAAMAAFFSGGSVAPPDCEPLPAPHDAAGRFAAGAILLAAAGSDDADTVLQTALKDGESLAQKGLKSDA